MQKIVENYRDWIGLGPGGLPANPVGWSITTALRPFGRDPMTVRGNHSATPWDLPRRPGRRPPVAPFPIPHRQTTDTADAARVAAVTDIVESYASGSRMYLSRSHFERRGSALYVHDSAVERVVKARGEIAHVHAGDGSLHVVADPADAQHVIEQGWGELHPLAGRPLLGLPESYVLLYSPRNDDDLRQLGNIVQRVVATALSE